MNKKKILVLAVSVALIAILAIGGSLAYFTDTTEAKVNAFTVGNVNIDLTEPEWITGDDHTLMPGTSYDKNPTITVDEKSQDCYVFLKIDMNKYVSLVNLMGVDAYKNNIGGLKGEYPGFIEFVNALASNNGLRAAVLDRWFTGINHSDWKVMNVDDILGWVNDAADKNNPTKLEVVLGYIGSDDDTLSAGESVIFMTAFGMPKTVTASMFNGEDAYYIDGVSKSNFKVVAPWSDYDGLFINSNWQRGSDGYYYYNGTVAANTTVTLFTAYTATDGPDGAHLEMDIISQVIQAEGMGATSAQDAFTKAANN